MLKQAKTCGWGADEEVDQIIRRLSVPNKAGYLWMDPDNRLARDARKDIAQIIADLPKIVDIKAQVAKKKESLAARLQFDLAGCGLLLQGESEWEISTSAHLVLEKRKALVLTTTEGGRKQFQEIAVVKQGKFVIADTAKGKLPEGTVVFIVGGTQ